MSSPAYHNQRGGPNKAARAAFAKHTINVIIPHILQNNARAKAGNESTERIYYNPSTVKIKSKQYHISTSKPASSREGPKPNLGKITGHFKPLTPKNENPGERSSVEGSRQSAPSHDVEVNNTVLDTAGKDDNKDEAADVLSGSTPKSQPKISVVQSDTLNAAQVFVDPKVSNRRIAVLNMASFLRPGGGVINGSIAQEESLCLRSTLYTSLDEKFYRLPKFGGLFTKDILVFRDSNNQDLPKSDWYFVDVISVAALKNPDLTVTDDKKEVYEFEQDKEEMISKIKLILLTALKHKTTHLILGALGCGAYNNPPEEVAKMFRRVLFGDRKGRGAMDLHGIEEIVFAIFDDGVNLRTFRHILEGAQGSTGVGVGGQKVYDQAGGSSSSGKEKESEESKDIEMKDVSSVV